MNESRMDGDLFGHSYLLEQPGEQRDNLEQFITSYRANDNAVVEFCSLLDSILNSILRLTFDISHRLIQFVEEIVHRDASRDCECWPITSSDHCSENFHCSICRSLEDNCSSSFSPHIGSTSCQTYARGFFDNREESVVGISSQVMRTHNIPKVVPFILQGLIIPVFGLQHAWKLTTLSWRFSISYIRNARNQVFRIATRVRTTLRGSSDDIGWLQHAAEMPPVEDGTPRFLELLSHTWNGEHTLPNSYVYLLIPGLLSNHGPLYFVSIKKFFSKMGLACHIAKIHSEASVEHNAMELKLYIDELYWGSGKRVMLLGHSKGGVDAAAALSMYWNDLKGKVAGLALVQSPYGGTPVASDILREGQIGDKETRRIMELLICKVIKGDIRALEDLTYEKRKEFILKHRLPLEIPIISFHSEANIALGVIATMTHIAHAELPWLPLPNFGAESSESPGKAGTQVPVVIPISAAMAICALHLQLRYGEKSDGVVTCRDAEVPGSVVVRLDRKLDHAWMVYSSRKENPRDPDGCDMCEALLTLLVELDKKRQEKDK